MQSNEVLLKNRHTRIKGIAVKSGVYFFLALAATAFLINLTVQTLVGEHINMFFVGPGNSSLAVFKEISKAAGWYVSTLLYLPTVCLGAFLVFLPVYLYKKRRAAKQAKDNPTNSQKTEKVPTRVG